MCREGFTPRPLFSWGCPVQPMTDPCRLLGSWRRLGLCGLVLDTILVKDSSDHATTLKPCVYGGAFLLRLVGWPPAFLYTCMSKLCALHSIFIWGMKRRGHCNLECMAVEFWLRRTNGCSYIKKVSLDYSANPCESSLLILRKDGDDRIIYLFIYIPLKSHFFANTMKPTENSNSKIVSPAAQASQPLCPPFPPVKILATGLVQ